MPKARRVPRRRAIICVAVVLAALSSSLMLPSSAGASTGCQALNQASLDGLYFGKEITLSALSAGDVVRISAGHPVKPSVEGFVPSSLHLILSDSAFRGATFPGTIEWVVFEDMPTPPRLKWVTSQDNETGAFAEVTWDIGCQDAPLPADTDPPDTSILSFPAVLSSSRDAAFSFGADEEASFTCSIDSGTPGSCTSPKSYQGLSDGPHTFTVIATDAEGNVDPDPPTWQWTVDATPPALSLPGDQVANATGPAGAQVNYVATATDGGSALPISCTPSSGSVFPVGTTAVSCGATDLAGNVSNGAFNVTVLDAQAQLHNVVVEVEGLGPGRSLEAKLVDAKRAVESGNLNDACSLLADVMRQISAQSGKSLTTSQADDLLGEVRRIRSVVGC